MSGPSPHRLDGLMILVVDEDRDAIDVLEDYLERAGARVVGANSASAGLAVAQTLQLDAILVAQGMRGEDGQSFLRQFRRARVPGAETVPVFAMREERHDPPDAQKGFSGWFLKPLDFDTILAIIAALAPLPRRP
jgi:DNA-binding response OmpR family regulator